MLAVTERAKIRLLEMKASANVDQPGMGLRLEPADDGQWRLFPDEATDTDEVVEHAGSKVLLIDADVSDAVGDGEVDCVETDAGDLELVLTRSSDR